MKVWIQVYENGEIMSWGELPLPGAIEVDAPSDFAKFSIAKYVVINGSLSVREGWIDPVE